MHARHTQRLERVTPQPAVDELWTDWWTALKLADSYVTFNLHSNQTTRRA